MKESDVANIAIALITAVLLAVGMYFFPLISDDLMSIVYVKGTFLHHESFDFIAYSDNLKYIFKMNHFRLPNLLMPFVILLPKWIPALLSGISIFYIMRAGSRLGKFSGSWKSMTLFASGFILLFPWVDQMYLISFQAPYLWGCAIALFLLKCLLRPRGLPIAATTFIGFLTGFWQEAYACAILGACICLMVFCKEYRQKNTTAILCSLFCGILVNILPLMLRGVWGLWPFFSGRMAMIYPYTLITLAYAAISLLMLRKYRTTVLNPVNLSLLEISIASACMTLYLKTGMRIDGLGIVCSIIGIIYLIRQLPVAKHKAVGFAAIITGLFSLCNVITVDALCYRLGKETDYILNQYRHTGMSPVFAPLTLRENAPLMALQKPYFDWFAHDNTLEVFNLIYGNDSVRLEVVPERLKYFSPGKAERVPGTAGVYVYDGLTVGTDSDTKWYMADFGQGSRAHRFHTVAFRGADGYEYVWLHLDYASLDFLMHPRPTKMDTAE